MTRIDVAEHFLAAALVETSYAMAANWLEAVAKDWWRYAIPGEVDWSETALADMANVLKEAAKEEAHG